MLLVVAGTGDSRGTALRRCLAARGARLMTPRDLQQPGWRHEPARPLDGIAVAEGEPCAVAGITGVCTLLPCVVPGDLPWIRAEDREYAAAEMTAFLCAWLSALPCPVLNQPSPACLCGPAWSPARWTRLAREASLPAVAGAQEEAVAVTVAGARAFGAQSAAQRDLAVELATLAGIPLLRVLLWGPPSSPVVAGADLWIDPALDGVADAIGALLEDR